MTASIDAGRERFSRCSPLFRRNFTLLFLSRIRLKDDFDVGHYKSGFDGATELVSFRASVVRVSKRCSPTPT